MANWPLIRNRASCLLSIGGRSRTVTANSIALKHRGPPRIFGKSKAQLLDQVMAKNAYFWLGLTCVTIPSLIYLMWRFNYVVLPEQDKLKEKVEADLLSEGRYNKE